MNRLIQPFRHFSVVFLIFNFNHKNDQSYLCVSRGRAYPRYQTGAAGPNIHLMRRKETCYGYEVYF